MIPKRWGKCRRTKRRAIVWGVVGGGGWGIGCEHVVEKNKYQLLSMVGEPCGKRMVNNYCLIGFVLSV